MNDELGGKIMTEIVAFRAKTYSYLRDGIIKIEKTKGTKNCAIKRMLKFLDYKGCLLYDKIILESQQRFKSEAHNVCTEEVDKNGLSSNDDKKLQAYHGITTYPYGHKGWKSMQNRDAK